MAPLTRFIDLFAGHIQSTREIDVETKILIYDLLDETMKEFKKTNVKDKSLNKNMKQNEKQRHFKFNGEKFKGTNGKFLRVAINKVTKIVRRVKPINWTTEAKLKFYEKFPDLIDTEKPKQKKAKKTKKPKKMKAEIKKEKVMKKEVDEKVKSKPKKKKISTFDLIASLVEQANGSLEENVEPKNDEIKETTTPKITEKEKKEIKETITQKIQFKTTARTHQKKKKKVTRNKKKEKKSNSEEIKVKEFTHDDLKETQYIDEQNNIWNDMHKQIGYYDRDTDTVTLLS